MSKLSPVTINPRGLQGDVIDACGRLRRVWAISIETTPDEPSIMIVIEGMGSALVSPKFTPIDLIIGGCDLLTASRVADLLSESYDRSCRASELTLMDSESIAP